MYILFILAFCPENFLVDVKSFINFLMASKCLKLDTASEDTTISSELAAGVSVLPQAQAWVWVVTL